MAETKELDSRVRRKARRLGYTVTKSRERKYVPHANNFGGYMLIDNNGRLVVGGYRYDATLDDIEAYLKDTRGRSRKRVTAVER